MLDRREEGSVTFGYCFGQPSTFGGPVETPTLDRLANEGLRYNHFHTNAVCAASRAALLTGRNAHSVGMGFTPETASDHPGYYTILPKSAATIGEILRQNGYATAWFGKSHLTPVYEITPVGPFDRVADELRIRRLLRFFSAPAPTVGTRRFGRTPRRSVRRRRPFDDQDAPYRNQFGEPDRARGNVEERCLR
jgi:arylsulfatase A-like enzyme